MVDVSLGTPTIQFSERKGGTQDMKYLAILAVLGLLAATASADWGHPVKWDQMSGGLDSYGGASWLDFDTPSDALSADDFMCTDGGWITEIELAGWSYYGTQYLDKFRVTFWSDVPATPNDASHPGQLLYDVEIGAANPDDPMGIGWKEVETNHFLMNLPEDVWFRQTRGSIYWIGIQGVMVNDGYFDAFYWNFADRNLMNWGDDAAFSSDYFGYLPWANWGVDWITDPAVGVVSLYDGPLPDGWTSMDMAFRLHGVVPEPGMLSLLALSGLGAVAFLRRK
jgi:hypothetical protein